MPQQTKTCSEGLASFACQANNYPTNPPNRRDGQSIYISSSLIISSCLILIVLLNTTLVVFQAWQKSIIFSILCVFYLYFMILSISFQINRNMQCTKT